MNQKTKLLEFRNLVFVALMTPLTFDTTDEMPLLTNLLLSQLHRNFETEKRG